MIQGGANEFSALSAVSLSANSITFPSDNSGTINNNFSFTGLISANNITVNNLTASNISVSSFNISNINISNLTVNNNITAGGNISAANVYSNGLIKTVSLTATNLSAINLFVTNISNLSTIKVGTSGNNINWDTAYNLVNANYVSWNAAAGTANTANATSNLAFSTATSAFNTVQGAILSAANALTVSNASLTAANLTLANANLALSGVAFVSSVKLSFDTTLVVRNLSATGTIYSEGSATIKTLSATTITVNTLSAIGTTYSDTLNVKTLSAITINVGNLSATGNIYSDSTLTVKNLSATGIIYGINNNATFSPYITGSNTGSILPLSGTNVASGLYSNIGGGTLNTAISAYAHVGGGYGNDAKDLATTVTGGSNNRALSAWSSIGGGSLNTALSGYTHIGGGWSNTASGWASSVVGGYGNTASNSGAVVGGGLNNTASGQYASTLGGRDNTVNSNYSIVNGGRSNTINNSNTSNIAGGQSNLILNTNYSFVAGGSSNYTSFDNTFILGSNLSASQANFTYVNNLSSIGTTKTATLFTTSISSRYINLEHSTPNDGVNPVLFIGERGDGTAAAPINSLSGFNITYDEVNNKLVTSTSFGALPSVTATGIDVNGNLGVGTDRPNNKLTVSGNISAAGIILNNVGTSVISLISPTLNFKNTNISSSVANLYLVPTGYNLLLENINVIVDTVGNAPAPGPGAPLDNLPSFRMVKGNASSSSNPAPNGTQMTQQVSLSSNTTLGVGAYVSNTASVAATSPKVIALAGETVSVWQETAYVASTNPYSSITGRVISMGILYPV